MAIKYREELEPIPQHIADYGDARVFYTTDRQGGGGASASTFHAGGGGELHGKGFFLSRWQVKTFNAP